MYRSSKVGPGTIAPAVVLGVLLVASSGALAARANSQGVQVGSTLADRVLVRHRAENQARMAAETERAVHGIAGDVRVTDRLPIPRPNGAIVDVEARAVVPRGAIARKLLGALPVVGTAITVADILNEVRCSQLSGGSLGCDKGQPKIPVEDVRYSTALCYSRDPRASGFIYTSRDAAFAGFVASWAVHCPTGNPDVRREFRQWLDPLAANPDFVQFQERSCNDSWGVCTNWSSAYGWERRVISTVRCPDGTMVLWRDDEVCTTPPDRWQNTPAEEAAPWVEQKLGSGPASRAPAVLGEMQGRGVGVEAPGGWELVGPPQLHRDRSVTTGPDGSTTVRDTYDVPGYVPGTVDTAPEVRWSERVVERVYPPGAVVPPPGADTGPGTPPGTITERPIEVKTCGLPGMPPCKIDETGTPTGEAALGPEVLDPTVSRVTSCVTNPLTCLPSLPSLSWSFALPTGCAVIPISGFRSYITQIDVCRFQPVFHDLMSVVWVLGGLFGAIGLFWRTSFSQ